MFRSGLVAALCIAALVPGALAQGGALPDSRLGQHDRTSASEKGSLLVYPKVEIRWDGRGQVIQDTFITLNNDYNADVYLQVYFVSETCTRADNTFTLSPNQTGHWSAFSGLPLGVSPWPVLGDAYPDPEDSGDLVMRGYVLVWAVNVEYEEIRWNHLYGGATIVNYRDGSAWEYNAYAFQVVDRWVANGEQSGSPGELNLDGVEYASGFSKLLLDFFASDSTGLFGDGPIVSADTDLTLLILSNDMRQDTPGAETTKAVFEIWNANEVGFSGMTHCMYKWDETPLSVLGGHFLRVNLQTDKGRARFAGVASSVCPNSTDQSLLGVAAKTLVLGEGVDFPMSGTTLAGAGSQSAAILYDVQALPPEKADYGDPAPARFERGSAGRQRPR